MTNRQEYMKEYHRTHKVKLERSEYFKKYRATHKSERNVKHRAYDKLHKDLNNARRRTQRYFNSLNLSKIPGYEIHHCCGYDEYTKFIYIPRSLHYKIHNRLRELNIDANTNHYNYIVDLINNCSEYTYIHI